MLTFISRLALGLAACMLMLPSRLISHGFYRVHLWVLLGLYTFAALVAGSSGHRTAMLAAIVAAVASYVGATLWLYQQRAAGTVALVVVIACGLITIGPWGRDQGLPSGGRIVPILLDELSASLLLGSTFAAMLLGHWYLNTPTMQLRPLQQLVLTMFGAVLLRAVVVAMQTWAGNRIPEGSLQWTIFALQWLAGLAATGLVTLMTWQTLKVPNTQSATGILYVGVILVFLGEMAALMPNL